VISSSQLKLLGVCNLTPDSFSDGGNLVQVSDVSSLLNSFKNSGFKAIDLGAESTAPFNAPVDAQEEKRRFEALLPWESLTADFEISIDTYRGDTFSELYWRIKEILPKAHLIWNDVSGKLDDELWETLERCPEADYVFCHNLAPTRAQTSSHMDFLWEGEDICEQLIHYFQNAKSEFYQRQMLSRLILDPCFGFSKTREQNHFLLKNFANLVQACQHGRFLLGISRKSFLRFSDLPRRDPKLILETEFMQSLFLGKILKELEATELYLRIHDAVLGKSITHYLNT